MIINTILSRRDLIVISKDGIVSSTKGVPSVFPITPETPATSMALASILVHLILHLLQTMPSNSIEEILDVLFLNYQY
jgi:hypothetical protein